MMKWGDGNKDGTFYSVCLVVNDNGMSPCFGNIR